MRRRRLGQEPVGREEERVVGAGGARLDPRVDVVRARGRLERRERVLRIAPDAAGDEMETLLEVGGGGRRDRPRLDDDRRLGMLVRWQQAAAEEEPARRGDPDARVTVRPGEALRGEQLVDRGRQPFADVAGERDREPVGRAPEAGDVLVELGRPAGPRTERLEHAVAELEATIEGGQMEPVGGHELPVDPEVSRPTRHSAATSRPPIAASGPRALATVSSHSASGSLR